MAVKIRMKMMGRKHRPFFRICAVDSRNPRDGRVLEELGTYDPMVTETDARALIKTERVKYWIGVGALASDKVKVLLKKYGENGTHSDAQRAARERLSLPKIVQESTTPTYVPPAPEPAAARAAEAPAEPAAEAATE